MSEDRGPLDLEKSTSLDGSCCVRVQPQRLEAAPEDADAFDDELEDEMEGDVDEDEYDEDFGATENDDDETVEEAVSRE